MAILLNREIRSLYTSIKSAPESVMYPWVLSFDNVSRCSPSQYSVLRKAAMLISSGGKLRFPLMVFSCHFAWPMKTVNMCDCLVPNVEQEVVRLIRAQRGNKIV